jgi:glycosyltransferase involved in cell wall biosynthesis
MSDSLPRVSAIVLTYQFEDYIVASIESVLAQDYPPELLEVVVIDDGSTDSTREVIAPYLDQVRYVYKDNGGLLSSVNRGFAEATGELLALQSGDDMWTPHKLSRQVAILRERPEVGLVYGDMEVVDNDRRVLHPSFWEKEGIVPRRGRPLGELVRANFVSGGTMIVRASLRERFHPLPPHAGWEDWWIAVRVAEVAELEYVAEPMLRYRFHGANMNLGVERDQAVAKAAHEMLFRRWLLCELRLDAIAPVDLLVGCRLYEHCVACAAQHDGLSTHEVVPRGPGDAERVGEHVRAGYESLARGDLREAMCAAARAFGRDVHDPRARDLLDTVAAAVEREPSPALFAPPGAASGVGSNGEKAPAMALPHAVGSGATPVFSGGRGRTTPRVTLGIATYNRDTYLAEAIASSLAQECEDFEIVVVDDGSTNPAIGEILAGFDDPRLRVVRHPENRGIAEAYNTMVGEGRGELIAMLGDDDVCMPGRLAREVAIFDAHPDTGVVHGDALVLDARGGVSGRWESRDFTPTALIQAFFRSHNYLVDPTRMVHRRVYEAVGGYDSSYPVAQDLHFWLRAAPHFRFRHCPGGPLVGFRRHGENTSDESSRQQEVADVECALEQAMERHTLRELVPELDWAVLDPPDAEAQALRRLAHALEHRALPLPGLAARVRERAERLPAPVSSQSVEDDEGVSLARGGCPPRGQPPRGAGRGGRSRGRLMMTAFGWNDSGGGTAVPRLAAKELVRRGWEVTVFHAATGPSESGTPYEIVESEQDGVRLLAVHNRAHGIWDLGNPLREIDDPPITAAFGQALDRLEPGVVHFHNLHNLGAALIDQAATRGIPSYFSTHNYWLICPRAYLMTGTGEICPGPGDGTGCAGCVHSPEAAAHGVRLAGIRARVARGVSACLTVSEAVRRTLLGAGYPVEMLDVVRQGMPHDSEIWERLGRERKPGRAGERLTVAFLGSAFPHKGPQLLVAAAQRTEAALRVEIHGEVPDAFAKQLREADVRGVVELCGAFHPSEIERVLAGVDVAALPSLWWDCAPLAAAECLAGRVPVIAPRLGGLAEAVEHEVDGLLFDALSVEDLARCLDRLGGEVGLLERLQSNIRAPRLFSGYVDELEAYYAGERPGRVNASPEPAQLGVRWQGDHGLSTSLSIVNARVIERLSMPVQRIAREGRALDGPLAHGADVEVRHQWPPDLRPAASGRLAVIQPWEFGAIPREWVPHLEANVDELWVPSESVRGMYLEAGLDPERVVVLPNGVDLERFSPDVGPSTLPALSGLASGARRFLFVGGLIWRKGPDLLLDAWKAAFPGREDVVLIVKDVGVGGVYRDGDRDGIVAHVASGALPRIVLLGEELAEEEIPRLYRSCDVLVHPYRGEGFAMPVLEAMACGVPVVVTEGGPTDEFCPLEAGWRIKAQRLEFSEDRVGGLDTVGRPWVLEPDTAHLVELLRAAAGDSEEAFRRGAAGRVAAERYGWKEIAGRYEERLVALAGASRVRLSTRAPGPPRARPHTHAPARPHTRGGRVFEEETDLRLLATPAWRGEDRLADLLAQWASATTQATSACLYLLADPRVDGSQEELHARVLDSGVDLEEAADVTVLMEAIDEGVDRELHEGVDAFVALHAACDGHARMASEAGRAVLSLDDGSVGRFLSEAPTSLAAA